MVRSLRRRLPTFAAMTPHTPSRRSSRPVPPPRLIGAEAEAKAFRKELHEALAVVRDLIENGNRAVVALSPGTLTVYVVERDLSPEFFDYFELLRFSGMLVPAGFEL